MVGSVVQADHIGTLTVQSGPASAPPPVGPSRRRKLLRILLPAAAIGTTTVLLLQAFAVPAGWFGPIAARSKACLVKLDPSVKSGYVWADRPHESSYSPSEPHQCNSTGAVNTVTRESAGRYTVRFPGLGTDSGTVDVTSADAHDRVCSVRDWGPARDDEHDQDVHVVCVDRDGTPTDSSFTASFLFTMGGSGLMAYLRADRPSSPPYTPASNHQFNSVGGVNTVEREQEGVYLVFLPGLHKSAAREGTSGGIVKVTSLGSTPNACSPVVWMPWRNPDTAEDFLVVRVACSTLRGLPVDAAFTLSYAVDLGSTTDAQVPGAHLWASESNAAEYTPMKDYQYNSTHALNTVTRTATGRYTVHLPGLVRPGGNPQVSAYNSTATCGVTGWRPVEHGHRVEVVCRGARGDPVDAQFAFLFRQ
ncbi:hypothetical protein ACQPW3_25050 [Actinosynnema sp. CA-248983]